MLIVAKEKQLKCVWIFVVCEKKQQKKIYQKKNLSKRMFLCEKQSLFLSIPQMGTNQKPNFFDC